MTDHPYGESGVLARMERALSWLNSLTKAVGLGVVVALLALNFDAIQTGLRGLAEKLPNLVKISAFGVNFELNPDAMEKLFKSSASPSQYLKDHWGRQNTKNAVEGLNSIDSRERARLMMINTGGLAVCRREKPNAEMLYEYASDKDLAEKGLATIVPAPDQPQRERAKVVADQYGASVDCYKISLTSEGFDVHTVMVQSLAAVPTLPAPTPETAPADTQPELQRPRAKQKP